MNKDQEQFARERIDHIITRLLGAKGDAVALQCEGSPLAVQAARRLDGAIADARDSLLNLVVVAYDVAHDSR